MSRTDPAIFETEAFKAVECKFKSAISEAPTYICDICIKFEYKSNVVLKKEDRYEDHELFNKCSTKKSDYICKSCHKSLLKGKMPMQAQANNLQLNPIVDKLKDLTDLETILISQLNPYMHIVAKHRGAQSGLKGQVVLVPADLRKIQSVLPKNTSDE